jgi:pilus assembly protein CpaE
MHAFVVGDHEPTAHKVRQVLLREGHDCPAENLHVGEFAADRIAQARPHLIVVTLSPDPDGAVSRIGLLRRAGVRCPIIAVGPSADSRLVIQTLREGAGDYVEETKLAEELATAVRRLRALSTGPDEPARTVALLAPSGGSGSSTLAVNIATVLAEKYKTTLLMDLKLQTGDLAALLDLKATHTLADLCQQASNMDRTLFERSLTKHSSGVHLLAPPRYFADAEAVTPEGVSQALAMAKNIYPFVIVDVDHSFAPEQVQALRQADVILVVLRLDFASLRNTGRTLDFLRQLRIDMDKVRVVVNRYGQSKEVPAAKAEAALGVKIAHFVPEDAATVNRANNNGVPVVRESPSARVSRSLAQLAASVNGRAPR